MTSSISWIDRDGLEATLARFGLRARRFQPVSDRRPREQALEETPHPVVADENVRVLPVEPAEEVDPVVESEPEPPSAEEIDEPREADPRVIPDFLPPRGPLRQRLEAFIGWLVQTSGTAVAFIVDRDGLPLIDRKADPDLLAIASSVMRLVESINSKLLFPVGRAVTLELEESQLLLMAVETPIGKYIVGQVGDHPMDRELRDAANDALRRAFQPAPEQEAASG